MPASNDRRKEYAKKQEARAAGGAGGARDCQASAKRQKRVPMSLEEAERLATQEGLVLVPSCGSTQSGYWLVTAQGSHSNTFQSSGTVGGRKEVSLGNFSTAHEAALAVARNLGPEGSREAAARTAKAEAAADRPFMGESEARQLASAEGLTLVPSSFNKTGFLNVSLAGRELDNADLLPPPGTAGCRRFFQVTLCKSTQSLQKKSRSLGCYKTVFEAALAFARHLGPEGCAGHMAALESAAANAKLREAKKEQAQRKREAALDARVAREAERVAAAVAARIAKKRAREEQEAEQAAAAVAAKGATAEAKAKAKVKALADKAAQLEVKKAAKALSTAAAAAAAKHEKLVAKQRRAKVGAARRVEYKKEWNKKDSAKKAKQTEALEKEETAAAKLLLVLPGMHNSRSNFFTPARDRAGWPVIDDDTERSHI